MSTKIQLENPRNNPFQKFKSSYLILGAIVISIIVAFFSVSIIDLISKNTPIAKLLAEITSVLLITAWTIFLCWGFRIDLQKLIGNKSSNIQWLSISGTVVSVFMFSMGAFYLTYYPLSLVAPNFAEEIIIFSEQIYSPPTSGTLIYNILLFLEIVVVAPIVEEFFFRGIILHRWATKWGVKPAIIASSILFGFCHLNFLGLSLFGVVMAILYLKTRSLIAPIFAHALNNAIAFVWIVTEAKFSSVENASFLDQLLNNSALEDFQAQWWQGVICFLVSLPFIWRFLSQNWSKNYTVLPYFTNS